MNRTFSFLLLAVVVASPLADTRGAALPPKRSTHYDGSAAAKVNYGSSVAYDTSIPMTIEAWVYREDATRCETIVSRNYSQSYWFGFCDGFLRFHRSGGAFADATGTVLTRQWRHVAASYDGTRVHFFIDGQPAGSPLLSNAGANKTQTLWLGGDSTGLNFRGNLDEVRIWMSVRTQAEIQADMFREVTDGAGLVFVVPAGGTDGFGLRKEVFGILPRDLVIPRGDIAVRMDGNLDTEGEYRGAEEMVIRYRAGDGVADARAYLIYRDVSFGDQNLYIGVTGVRDTLGGWPRHNSFIGVNVDPNLSRDALAQTNDFRVRGWLDASEATWGWGNGAGVFPVTTTSPPTNDWQVAYSYFCSGDLFPPCMEFRINHALLGNRFGTNGLMIGHFDINSAQLDFPAPGDADGRSPATWPLATYGDLAATFPTARIQGHVYDRDDAHRVADHRITLLDEDEGTQLYVRTTDSVGAFQFNVAVPPGHRLRVLIDECSSCRYLAPRIGSGIAPTFVNSREVVFPGCSTGTCDYASADFFVLRPIGPIVLTTSSSSNGVPRIRLSDVPGFVKELPPDLVTLYGNNLHPYLEVYLYDCPFGPPDGTSEPPAVCAEGREFYRVPIRSVDPAGTSMTVELPLMDIARFVSKPWDWLVHDSWNRPGRREWTFGPERFVTLRPPYPLLHGFEFSNQGDDHNFAEFRAVFRENVYTIIPCVPDPYYLLFFPIYAAILNSINGSCVGMAATSQMFARDLLRADAFIPGVHFAAGFPGRAGPPATHGGCVSSITPPIPDHYHEESGCTTSPANLWAQILVNHGVQLSGEFLNEVLAQIDSSGLISTTPSSFSGNPVQVLNRVRGNPLQYVIDMVPAIGSAHAVTPYAVQDEVDVDGDGVVDRDFSYIRVYDNNCPENLNRFITIDKRRNRYIFPLPDYQGNGIYAVPLSIWLGEKSAPDLFNFLDFIWHVVAGNADALVETGPGQEWGWKTDGSVVDGIPGAKSVTPAFGPESETHQVPLFIPITNRVITTTINVHGSNYLFQTARSGRVLQVETSAAKTGDKDHVQLQLEAGQLDSMRYRPQSPASNFVVRVGAAPAKPERVIFTWNGLTANGGNGLLFHNRPDGRSTEYRNDSITPTRHSLTIQTVDGPSGNSTQNTFGPFDIAPGALHRVSVADWPKGQRLLSEVDKDNDGVFETTVVVGPANAGPQPEPPTVFSGFVHTPLGQAKLLQAVNTGLVINSIGSSGGDGVHIEFGSAVEFRVKFAEIVGPMYTRNSTAFAIVPTGRQRRELGRVSGIFIGSAFNTAVDFSAISSTHTLRVFKKEALLFEETGRVHRPNDPIYASHVLPARLPQHVTTRVASDGSLQVTMAWDSPLYVQVFLKNGDALNFNDCDRVEINSEPSKFLPYVELSGLALTFNDMQPRTIVDESISAFGLDLRGLGQGALRASSGVVTVTGFSTTGNDGAKLDLRGATDAQLSLDADPSDPIGTAPDGAQLIVEVAGPTAVEGVIDVNTLSAQSLGQLRFKRAADGLSVAPDYSALAATRVQLEVRQGGTWKPAVGGSFVAQILDPAKTVNVSLNAAGALVWNVQWSAPIQLRLSDSTSVSADAARWTGIGGKPIPPGRIRDLILRGISWPSIRITDVTPGYGNATPPITASGVLYSPLGFATLASQLGGDLRVSNLTTSGNDGVRMQFTDRDELTVKFDSIIPARTVPNGTSFEVAAVDSTNANVTAQQIVRLRGVNINGNFNLAVDFSGAGSPTYKARAYEGNLLRAESRGPNPQAPVQFNTVYFPDEPAEVTFRKEKDGNVTVVLRWPKIESITLPQPPNGTQPLSTVGDRLELATERSLNAPVVRLVGAELRWSHIGSRVLPGASPATPKSPVLKLGAVPIVAGMLELSWEEVPATPPSTPEETDRLGGVWHPVTIAPVRGGGRAVLRMPLTGAARFIRLRTDEIP